MPFDEFMKRLVRVKPEEAKEEEKKDKAEGKKKDKEKVGEDED